MGFNSPTNTFETFSDLRLTVGQSSSSVTVLGGATINDNLGGRFYWDNTSTAPDDNQFTIKPTILGPSDPGRWIKNRVFSTQTLQDITNNGNETTNSIVASRYVATIDNNIPSVNPGAFYVKRTTDSTISADSTAFRDATTFNRPSNGYNSYDAIPTITVGSHFTAYQSRPFVDGNTGDIEGYWSWIIHRGGTVQNYRNFIAGSGDNLGGTIVNSFGLIIEDNRPGTNKYAIASYDPNAQTVHAGKVRVGDTTNPTDQLEVAGNITSTQSIKAQGNLTPGLTTLPNGINLGNNVIAAGGTGNQNLTYGTRNDGKHIFTQYGTSFGNPVAEFQNGPVIGQPAQAGNHFATLSQVQSYGLPFENYPLFTSVSATGPNAVIFVTQDNSPSGDNTESQFFRHNNKLFYIPTIQQ